LKNKTPLFLLIFGVILYTTLVLIIWQDRYFYDDELINLNLISKFTYSGLIDLLSRTDLHPPGQYLINKLFYSLFGPDELLLSLPSIICIGISVGLTGIITFRITESSVAGLISVLFASTSSLLLMWGWSIRWYPYWTFIIFLSLFLLLKVWRDGKVSITKGVTLILLFSAGLYLNYLSLLFLFAVILTSLFIDYRNKNLLISNFINSNFYKTTILILAALIVFSPWILNFSFQLESYLNQNEINDILFNRSPLIIAGYYFFNGLFGSSIYPWNASFLILFSGLLISGIVAGFLIYTVRSSRQNIKKEITTFGIIIFFTIIFFTIVTVWAGFAQILRSHTLILFPLLISILLTLSGYKLFQRITSQEKSKKLKIGYSYSLLAMFFFAGIWVVGLINVFNKDHFHKMGLSDPIGAVLHEIKENINESAEEPVAIMTINPVLAYYISKFETNNYFLITPSDDYKILPDKKISKSEIIFVETYLGSYLPFAEKYFEIKSYIKNKGYLQGEPVYLGRDVDYQMKKNVASAYLLPEYRFIIYKFKPYNTWDTEKILLLKQL
jgi:hypothetical protein